MKKVILSILISLCFTISSYAGNDDVTLLKGKVVDTQGEPIIGAKVVVKGTKTAVYTDFEGQFIFPSVAKTSHKVKVSMISYQDKEATVNFQDSNNELSITLKSK